VRPTRLPFHWAGVGHFPGVQRRGREPEHSTRSTVEVKNEVINFPLHMHSRRAQGQILKFNFA
jgi:hypothetical protein